MEAKYSWLLSSLCVLYIFYLEFSITQASLNSRLKETNSSNSHQNSIHIVSSFEYFYDNDVDENLAYESSFEDIVDTLRNNESMEMHENNMRIEFLNSVNRTAEFNLEENSTEVLFIAAEHEDWISAEIQNFNHSSNVTDTSKELIEISNNATGRANADTQQVTPKLFFTSGSSRENVRRGRQVPSRNKVGGRQVPSRNKAGRRARLPSESSNTLRKDEEKFPTVSRSPLVPDISVIEIDKSDPVRNSTADGNPTSDEIEELIETLKKGRAATPVLFGNNDLDKSEQCTLPRGRAGTCTPLVNCNEVLRTIRSQSPVICRWINDMPVVCCPSATLGRRISDSRGCGKRLLPGISKPRRVRRQVPRIIPDFTGSTTERHHQTQLVAGGQNADLGAWPWMAGIYTRNFGIENFLCGAAIISPYYLVTAAHCFGIRGGASGRISPSRYAIRVGSIKVREGVLHLVENITVHPGYIPREYYNDIAVIQVKDPIQFGPSIQPICLPVAPEIRRKKLKGRDVTVAGWGDQEFGGKRATILQEVTVQVIDPPTCDKAYLEQRGTSIPRGITNQFLCAGVPEGGKDACQRDSGGPLMLLENDVWVLVGIVSFGFQCARAEYPGVYTRVTNYMDWLQTVTSDKS